MSIIKKSLAGICLFALLLTFLTSCTSWFYTWFYGKKPWCQPMTKWAAEGIELYVLQTAGDEKSVYDAIMIAHYGDTRMFYDVSIHPYHIEKGYGMTISDIHETASYLSEPSVSSPSRFPIYYGDVEPISDTEFRVTLSDCEIFGGGYDIPELMFPKELTFTRVAENLTEADIPEITLDQQYEFCPTYRAYSRWISNDLQMTLYVYVLTNVDKRTKCQLSGDSDVSFYVNFFESSSSVFLTKITEENVNAPDKSLITSNSGEEWRCEYFEDYFLATVIRSEYYEAGHVLTFTLLPPLTYSEAKDLWEN